MLGVSWLFVLGGFVVVSWLASRFGAPSWRRQASLAVLGLSLAGLLYMIYLTFLEPFVIGATCAWGLTSAVIRTLIVWFSLDDGLRAWQELASERSLASTHL